MKHEGGLRRGLRLSLSYFFFSLATSRAVQEISIVYALAALVISGVFISLVVSEVRYGTTLLSRKSRNAPVLIAKFMFSGRSPVAFANLSALSFSATTPTIVPRVSSNGPPLLPG